MNDFEFDYIKGKINPNEYWDNVLRIFEFDEIGDNCPDLAEFVKSTLNKGFQELNNLDRQHEFWKNTNKLATLYKMHDYADYLIKSSINPLSGAWLNVCLALVQGQQHLKNEYWQIVKDCNQMNPRWLVLSAWNTSSSWFDLNIETLSNLIIKLDLIEDMKEPLDFLVNTVEAKDMEPSEWVEKIIEQIKQKTV